MEKTNIQRGEPNNELSWNLILEAIPKHCLTQLKVKLFPWAEKKKGGQTSLLYNGARCNLKKNCAVQSKCIQT